MQILDGKVVRDKIAENLKAEISRLDQKPGLVIFQVGDVAESNTYIGQKIKFGEKIGAIVEHKKLPADIPEHEIIEQIQLANEDENINGIIVQMPIPDALDKNAIIEAIDPQKDVDGQTAANIKKLVEGQTRSPGLTPGESGPTPGVFPGFVPATTKGIFTLLDFYKIPVEGKHVVVVGRSTLVGKPTALLALNKDATVTIAHSKTSDLGAVTKSADILIVAVGRQKLIGKEHVTKDQVVVDVGINVVDLSHPRGELSRDKAHPGGVQSKLVGDVDFEQVSKIVKAISPIPGGVGPMTVASLFQNLLKAYKNQA